MRGVQFPAAGGWGARAPHPAPQDETHPGLGAGLAASPLPVPIPEAQAGAKHPIQPHSRGRSCRAAPSPWLLHSQPLGDEVPGPQSALPPTDASPRAGPSARLIRACLQPAGPQAEGFWEGISGNEGGRAESFLICRRNVCFARIPTASNELNEVAGRSPGRFQEKRAQRWEGTGGQGCAPGSVLPARVGAGDGAGQQHGGDAQQWVLGQEGSLSRGGTLRRQARARGSLWKQPGGRLI